MNRETLLDGIGVLILALLFFSLYIASDVDAFIYWLSLIRS